MSSTVTVIPPVAAPSHSIRIVAEPGEHWRCMCGSWAYDNPRCLTPEEVKEVLREHFDHLRFEAVYG